MTADELYAKGYTLEWQAWGVTVYRTVDGSPGSSTAHVNRVATIQFDRPHKKAEAAARGWEAAAVHFVEQRLST